jgi:hypothetical protein
MENPKKEMMRKMAKICAVGIGISLYSVARLLSSIMSILWRSIPDSLVSI